MPIISRIDEGKEMLNIDLLLPCDETPHRTKETSPLVKEHLSGGHLREGRTLQARVPAGHKVVADFYCWILVETYLHA